MLLVSLNIILVIIGTLATLCAFGGESWKNDKRRTLYKRITRRGWLSLVCLFLALTVGVYKEILSKQEADEAWLEATTQNTQTKNQLTRALSDLEVDRQTIIALQTQAANLRLQISSLENELKLSIADAVKQVPKVVDHPFFSTESGAAGINSNSGGPLILYAGDQLEYEVMSDETFPSSGIKILIGMRVYPLSVIGKLTVIGEPGRPMNAAVIDTARLHFALKMTVLRTGDATELQEIPQVTAPKLQFPTLKTFIDALKR